MSSRRTELLGDLKEVNVKSQVSSSQRVIGIQRHLLFGDVGHYEPGYPIIRLRYLQLLADLWLEMWRELLPVYLHYHFLLVWAIRLVRRHFGSFRFTWAHSENGLFKTGD